MKREYKILLLIAIGIAILLLACSNLSDPTGLNDVLQELANATPELPR